jgi:hypothetical protein
MTKVMSLRSLVKSLKFRHFLIQNKFLLESFSQEAGRIRILVEKQPYEIQFTLDNKDVLDTFAKN